MSLLERAMTKDLNRLRVALDQEREKNTTLTQQVERLRTDLKRCEELRIARLAALNEEADRAREEHLNAMGGE